MIHLSVIVKTCSDIFYTIEQKKVSDAICEDTQLFSLSQPDEPITCSSGCIFPASCN